MNDQDEKLLWTYRKIAEWAVHVEDDELFDCCMKKFQEKRQEFVSDRTSFRDFFRSLDVYPFGDRGAIEILIKFDSLLNNYPKDTKHFSSIRARIIFQLGINILRTHLRLAHDQDLDTKIVDEIPNSFSLDMYKNAIISLYKNAAGGEVDSRLLSLGSTPTSISVKKINKLLEELSRKNFKSVLRSEMSSLYEQILGVPSLLMEVKCVPSMTATQDQPIQLDKESTEDDRNSRGLYSSSRSNSVKKRGRDDNLSSAPQARSSTTQDQPIQLDKESTEDDRNSRGPYSSSRSNSVKKRGRDDNLSSAPQARSSTTIAGKFFDLTGEGVDGDDHTPLTDNVQGAIIVFQQEPPLAKSKNSTALGVSSSSGVGNGTSKRQANISQGLTINSADSRSVQTQETATKVHLTRARVSSADKMSNTPMSFSSVNDRVDNDENVDNRSNDDENDHQYENAEPVQENDVTTAEDDIQSYSGQNRRLWARIEEDTQSYSEDEDARGNMKEGRELFKNVQAQRRERATRTTEVESEGDDDEEDGKGDGNNVVLGSDETGQVDEESGNMNDEVESEGDEEEEAEAPKMKRRAKESGQPRRKWTTDEETALIAAIKKHGPRWATILIDPKFKNMLAGRTNVNLKDKSRNLLKKGLLLESDF